MPYPDGTYDAAGNYAGGVLYWATNEIPLFPGDRAILFLKRDAALGEFYPQSYTGTYLSRGAMVDAVEGNPFGARIESMSEAELLALLRSVVP